MNKGELQLSIDRSTEELEKIEHELEVMVNIERKGIMESIECKVIHTMDQRVI